MHVIARKIIRHEHARRRVDRVNVTAAAEDFLDVGARKFTRLGLVAQQLAPAGGEDDLAAFALRGDWLRCAGCRSDEAGDGGRERKAAE
jgi:hypothetical protein